MERKDHKVNKGLLDPQDPQVLKDHKGWQEQKVPMVLMERKEHKVNKGLLDPQDPQVLKDHKGWQEQKVPMVQTDCPHMKHG
jgi:FtsZ-binding cell division protein ZapB